MQEILAALNDGLQQYGMLGLGASGLVVAVRAFRLPVIQAFVPTKWKWDALPKLAKWGLMYGLTACGLVATYMLGGVSFAAALSAAIPLVFAASGINEGTEAIGAVIQPMILGTGKKPGYVPSKFRVVAGKTIGLIAPGPNQPKHRQTSKHYEQ